VIGVLILTLNEEQNLPGCLESVRWCGDVVELDSFSVDRTVDDTRAAGARVVQRRFDNWSAHQNWAHANIRFAHPWVFYLDADERMTPDLRAEI
jgi:glycosyltransferase involved in cell wall biosynthesis